MPSDIALQEGARAVDLFKALAGEDELGVVVRAHIHLESELQAFVAIVLPKPEALGQFNYAAKVRLALACGIRPDLKLALTCIGKLRNDFAHRIGKSLTTGDADVLFGAFAERERVILGRTYSNMKSLTGRDLGPAESLSPKDRIVLYLVVLWSALFAERLRRSGIDPDVVLQDT